MKTIKRRHALVDPDDSDVDVHPLVSRLFANRGVQPRTEMDYSLASLIAPTQLKDIDRAAQRLVDAITKQQRVLVIGDYDTDGATATALAITALRAMGLQTVDYLVPNRFDFGYGLSKGIAEVALTVPFGEQPDLVITVDNGIASIDGVDLLNDHGIDVVVTDHHLPGEELPQAYAIVNPNQPGCEFASKSIAGVGVIFYLMMQLRSLLEREHWFAGQGLKPPRLADYLDLVALGTVTDMVPLDRNNRILVAQGIARIRRGNCRPGIAAIMSLCNRDLSKCRTGDFGFQIGPRLNAAGRLDDISNGIECLLTSDKDAAQNLAEQLDAINRQRKEIESSMQRQANEIVGSFSIDSAVNRRQGYCLFHPDWHQGVTGLVASRIKEQTHAPVIALAPAENGLLTGSARSVSGLHIRDLLAEIDREFPGLMDRFGGHAMAAGLTIQSSNLDRFDTAFVAASAKVLAELPADAQIESDGELQGDWYTKEVAEMVADAAPWGQRFPEPVFDDEFDVLDYRIVGEQHLKLTLSNGKLPAPVDAIKFRYLSYGDTAPRLQRIAAAFRIDVNTFRGVSNLQLLIEHMAPI
ncbi:MAG: single-stranded-DNA-specific exonuclease RecJ [Pseudomonadota bacterium]